MVKAPDLSVATKQQITDYVNAGFGNYVNERNIAANSKQTVEKSFTLFLQENPDYRQYVARYLNLTKTSINEVDDVALKTMPNASVVSVGQTLKTVNQTVGNQTYELQYKEMLLSDGSKITKVSVSGDGITSTDPYITASVEPIIYNVLGFNIQVGEDDYFRIGYPFDRPITHHNDAVEQRDAILLGLAGEVAIGSAIAYFTAGATGGATGIAGIFNVYLATYMGFEVNWAYNSISSSQDYDRGLYFTIKDHYIYPSFCLLIHSSLELYTYRYDLSEWVSVLPDWTYYFTSIEQYLSGPQLTFALQTNAFFVSHQIHHWIDDLLDQPITGYQWFSSVPGTPSVPSNAEVTVPGRDSTANQNLDGVNTQFDGWDLSTSQSTTYSITPETHSYWSPPTTHLYENGYQFLGYDQLGNDNQLIIEITSDTTITANYVETQWFSASAFEPSTGTVWTDIYIDGNYAGNGVINLEIPKGSHTVSVAYQTVHWGELVTCDYYSDTVYLGNSPVDKSFEYHFGQ